MSIETDDLAALRETTSKALFAVLWLHVPIAIAIGMARGEGWVMPAAIMVAMALAATLSWRMSGDMLPGASLGDPERMYRGSFDIVE